jgi:hypothetical protein
MALLLGKIVWETECEHPGCTDHQRRVQYQYCYAGEEAFADSVAAESDYRGGHAVEVPYAPMQATGEADLLRWGWVQRGRCWICPRHAGP